MENHLKFSGQLKSAKPTSGGAVAHPSAVYGIVKDNIDAIRTGNIKVYIADHGGADPDDANCWVPVRYMSPFYGVLKSTGGEDGYGSFKNNSISYGVWNSPPDIGTTVICIFINGFINYGYYIGCVPEPESLHMVPAIGANRDDEPIIPDEGELTTCSGTPKLPVSNINTNNQNITNSDDFLNQPKPIHSHVAKIMVEQGIIRDTIRGPIGTSAQRESPSRVGWGVSTPGRPIYTEERVTSREGGHSFVMDDGDADGNDQLIRLRTAQGHQILMSDTGDLLMLLHANGKTYIELGSEGTIDVFSTNSVNVRTQGDLNLHADNNINIHAEKKLSIFAENITQNAGVSINQNAEQDIITSVGGKYTMNAGDIMAFDSGADAAFHSGGDVYISGSPNVNLNTGSGPATESAEILPIINYTDTLYDPSTGYTAAPGTLPSIVSRAPAHMPWVNAGEGADVPEVADASEELPDSPSDLVMGANNTANTNPPDNPITTAIAATVGSPPAISESLDKATTATLLGTMSVDAATGLAATAVKDGAGVFKDAAGALTASIGAFAQTPDQLIAAGILKPGSSTLINALVAGGSNITDAIPSTLFTGKGGITNLESYTNNIGAQLEAQSSVLQNAQIGLMNSGLFSGKESATSIAGLVMSGANAGINETITAVKNMSSGALGTTLNGSAEVSSVTNAISSGNFAAALAQNTLSGLGGVTNGIGMSAITDPRGPAAGAFSAITNSFSALKVNIPQVPTPDSGAI